MKRDDETIGAFVDDEMDPAEADALAREAAGDPTLFRAIDRQVRVRRQLRETYAPIMDQAPPPRLTALLAQTQPRRTVEKRRVRVRWRTALGAGLALAASIAVAFGLDAQLSPRSEVAIGPGGRLAARGDLAEALDRRLGAEAADARSGIRLMASFTTPDGRYCRLFQTRAPGGAQGLACKDANGWAIDALAAGRPVGSAAFQQAASRLPRAIVDAMDEADVSEPLTGEQERSARAINWRAAR